MNTLNDNMTERAIKRITCQELEAFIMDFIDERLSEEQQAIFNTHLDECASCKSYVADYHKSIKLSQTAFGKTSLVNTSSHENEMPEELVEAILKANKLDS